MRNKGMMWVVLMLLFLAACSGPDEKKQHFTAKAKGLMAKGDLVKAGLELKNAIQIDPKYADAHYLLGQVELRRGNYQKAFGSFSKAVELAPGNLDAQTELGKLFLMQGDKEKAREKADLVLKTDPGHTEGRLLQVGVMMAAKEWQRSAGLLVELIAGGITKPDVYQMLALTRTNMNDVKGTETALKEGAQKNPADLGIYKSLADLYAAGGRVDEAAASIRRMMELEPANYGYGITLAGLFLGNGRKAEADDILGKLLATNPKNEGCLTALAAFYLSRLQPDDAEKVLKDGIQAVPRSFGLRFALSDLYNGTGRSDKGVALLKECLNLEKDQKKPDVIMTRYLTARIHFLRGELPEAELQLAEILKASPTNIEANYLKGRIHLQKREGPAAISAFRSVINNRPKEVEGFLFLADAHIINNEPKLALENLQQAERLEPDSLLINRAYVRLFTSQKEYRQGEERLQLYLGRHPDDLQARLEMGDLFRLAGEFRRAEAEYGTVKRRIPKSPLPYARISDLSLQQGNVPRAIAELEIIVRKLDPNNIPTALILANLYTRTTNVAKARQLYEDYHALFPKEWRIANDYACFLTDSGTTAADLERALSLAKEVAGQRPDDPFVMDTLGWVEYRKGNGTRAVEILEKANVKLAGNATVSYHLGMAYFQTGKKEQAKIYLNKAVAGGDFPGKQVASETLRKL